MLAPKGAAEGTVSSNYPENSFSALLSGGLVLDVRSFGASCESLILRFRKIKSTGK